MRNISRALLCVVLLGLGCARLSEEEPDIGVISAVEQQALTTGITKSMTVVGGTTIQFVGQEVVQTHRYNGSQGAINNFPLQPLIFQPGQGYYYRLSPNQSIHSTAWSRTGIAGVDQSTVSAQVCLTLTDGIAGHFVPNYFCKNADALVGGVNFTIDNNVDCFGFSGPVCRKAYYPVLTFKFRVNPTPSKPWGTLLNTATPTVTSYLVVDRSTTSSFF